MLKINGLDTYYGESKIIDNLSLEVPKGKIVCLIGRNGVGKSTTLKSIMGLTKTPKGSIMFDGKEIIKMKPYERAKLGIGYVPQGRDIFPQMTVEEELWFLNLKCSYLMNLQKVFSRLLLLILAMLLRK